MKQLKALNKYFWKYRVRLDKNFLHYHALYYANEENEHDLQIALAFSEYHYQLLHQNFLYKNTNRLQEKERSLGERAVENLPLRSCY